MFNIVASELIFAAIFLGVLWYTWPDPPWLMLQIVGVSVMILAPFLFYPFSKTLFLAFDLGLPTGEPRRVSLDRPRVSTIFLPLAPRNLGGFAGARSSVG